MNEGFLSQSGGANTWLDNWFLALAFGLQIYFDFAAYSNMAIGAARMIGITLPENFNCPYHAKNLSHFWQRWHMTLSRWIRDYMFFPVNLRFQASPLPLYCSLVGIMGWLGSGMESGGDLFSGVCSMDVILLCIASGKEGNRNAPRGNLLHVWLKPPGKRARSLPSLPPGSRSALPPWGRQRKCYGPCSLHSTQGSRFL